MKPSAVPMLACEDIATHPDFQSLRGMPEIDLDLRYATPDNFVSRDVYGPLDCAYLRKDAAAGGFHTIATEWWHFEFGDREQARATLPHVL